MKILLSWLNLNSLKGNSGKFPFLILRKFLRPKYCLTIRSVDVKEADHVDLLGITTDKLQDFFIIILVKVFLDKYFYIC